MYTTTHIPFSTPFFEFELSVSNKDGIVTLDKMFLISVYDAVNAVWVQTWTGFDTQTVCDMYYADALKEAEAYYDKKAEEEYERNMQILEELPKTKKRSKKGKYAGEHQ